MRKSVASQKSIVCRTFTALPSMKYLPGGPQPPEIHRLPHPGASPPLHRLISLLRGSLAGLLRGVIREGHTQSSYVEVIRGKWDNFFRYTAIRGPYGKPYVEVIRGGHTWSCFSIGCGITAEAIRAGHTGRSYGIIFLDIIFYI